MRNIAKIKGCIGIIMLIAITMISNQIMSKVHYKKNNKESSTNDDKIGKLIAENQNKIKLNQ